MHVLDIGTGSGLLSMMAARAGAGRVTSLEMVPALAAAARHIVGVNGYAENINILTVRSDELDEQALGGKADLLVCEIVDDQLLGEGVLSTVADARRRLLKPGATILPRGATVYALAVELRVPSRAGLSLDDMNLFWTDQALCPRASTGTKLQQHPPGSYKVLAAPLALFEFDWATSAVNSLCDARSRRLDLVITKSGVLNAFLIYFRLHLDEDPANTFSSGPDNLDLTAWDQNTRLCPPQQLGWHE